MLFLQIIQAPCGKAMIILSVLQLTSSSVLKRSTVMFLITDAAESIRRGRSSCSEKRCLPIQNLILLFVGACQFHHTFIYMRPSANDVVAAAGVVIDDVCDADCVWRLSL